MLRYPSPGCIVEFLEGNAVQIAMVIGETGERLKILLPSRREQPLPKNRILPWIGPLLACEGREESIRCLLEHKRQREEIEAGINVFDLWEMAQGEVTHAGAQWFAELTENEPSVDTVAAYGHALLSCKTRFRFQPPAFQILTAEEAEKKEAEEALRKSREALLESGRAFLQILWEVALGRRKLPVPSSPDWPCEEVLERIEELLFERMRSPEETPGDTLWKQLIRSLPDAPQMPLQLLLAWGKVPPHYNVWLDVAGYSAGDGWWKEEELEVTRLREAAFDLSALPEVSLPFISIDSETTKDIDDAFYLEKNEGGWSVTIALACPSFAWDFSSSLDTLILSRGTSLYLPEMTCHMLPQCLGTDAYSLLEGCERPAFLVHIQLDLAGRICSVEPSFARVTLAANLHYADSEALLTGVEEITIPFKSILREADELTLLLQKNRLHDGALILDRPEPEIHLSGEGADTRVSLVMDQPTPRAQRIVAEWMILASQTVAGWAVDRSIPLLFRTQNLSLPEGCSGIYTKPEDVAKMLRLLLPSLLETKPAPHAALGVTAYAPVTSPLRRYADFLNEAQLLAFWRTGTPRFSLTELEGLLTRLCETLERVGQVQRFRPRYWKLVYFRQQGSERWWQGVITEVHDGGVTVALPAQAMIIRAKRALFDAKILPGTRVLVRIGKVHPLWNELQIVEARADEQASLVVEDQ